MLFFCWIIIEKGCLLILCKFEFSIPWKLAITLWNLHPCIYSRFFIKRTIFNAKLSYCGFYLGNNWNHNLLFLDCYGWITFLPYFFPKSLSTGGICKDILILNASFCNAEKLLKQYTCHGYYTLKYYQFTITINCLPIHSMHCLFDVVTSVAA